MRWFKALRTLAPAYCIVLVLFLLIGIGGSHAYTAFSENRPLDGRKTIIIDAGHGGEDGGAISCTGVPESKINLQIALRLEDLLQLLGIETYMIRKEDISVYTKGDTLASKKVSDLKNRVATINSIKDTTLISIHLNHFSDSRYSGAQVFYANTANSEKLAKTMQSAFIQTLNRTSKRSAKRSEGVYLMEHINCTGILVECGFLSNPEEEALLRSEEYQKKLCCVIASVCSKHLCENMA